MMRTTYDQPGSLRPKERVGAPLTAEQAVMAASHTAMVRAIAWAVARRLAGRTMTVSELESAGREALVKAARRYVPGGPASFATYARHRIHGAMIDELRKRTPGARKRSRRRREPDPDPTVRVSGEAFHGLAHLADGGPSPEGVLVAADQRCRVLTVVATLGPGERKLIEALYMQGRTMTDHARETDVSVATVSRRHAKAIELLRKRLLSQELPMRKPKESAGASLAE